jgi:hypothetical protein
MTRSPGTRTATSQNREAARHPRSRRLLDDRNLHDHERRDLAFVRRRQLAHQGFHRLELLAEPRARLRRRPHTIIPQHKTALPDRLRRTPRGKKPGDDGPPVPDIEGQFHDGRFIEINHGLDVRGTYIGRLIICDMSQDHFRVRKDRLYDDGAVAREVWVYEATRAR